MSFTFSYKTLDAAAIFSQLKAAYNITDSQKRIDVPASLGGGFTQQLLLLSDIEILISEYDYVSDILFKHEAEESNNLVLWIDMAATSGQQVSINHQHLAINQPEQANAYLLNSGFNYSQFRSRGTRGKSVMIFLPKALMEQLFNPDYLREVLSNYYAVLCRGISFARLSTAQQKNVNAVFHQWARHENILSVTKNIHQLVESFFINFFKQFAAIQQKVTVEETADLLAVEEALNRQLQHTAPDMDVVKRVTALPFAQIETKFKILHNKTLHQYFREQKISKGMVYLRGGMHVAEVAFELGYANPSNFSASFKKMYGLTADEFRRQFQNN